MTTTEKITVQSVIDASPEKVWDLYTAPKHIMGWNFASDDWHCPRAENDVRVGGKLSSRMEARDGSMGFDFTVIYDKVVPQRELAYTMEDGRQARITFESQNGKTVLTTSFDPESQNPREFQQAGWQAISDNFKKYVENH